MDLTQHEPEVPPIELIRAAVARHVRATSLRGMARKLGLTPTGLFGFLNGARPQPATLHRYVRWYLADASDIPPTDVREVALEALLIPVHPEARPAVREELLRCLARAPATDDSA